MQSIGIIEYISGLTGFIFDKSVLIRIAIDRGVLGKDPADLSQQERDLLTADLLYTAYLSPNTMASRTDQHGSFTRTVGSQTIQSREDIYNMMKRLYRKWNDDKAEEVEASFATLRWME